MRSYLFWLQIFLMRFAVGKDFYSYVLNIFAFENVPFIDLIVNHRIKSCNIDLISSSQLPFCCCFSIV